MDLWREDEAYNYWTLKGRKISEAEYIVKTHTIETHLGTTPEMDEYLEGFKYALEIVFKQNKAKALGILDALAGLDIDLEQLEK